MTMRFSFLRKPTTLFKSLLGKVRMKNCRTTAQPYLKNPDPVSSHGGPMFKGRGFFFLVLASFYWLTLPFTPSARAQQTLGGITGTVTDKSGGALTDTAVTIVSEQTKLSRTQKTNESGTYDFVNLPIGTYRVTFTREGFQTQAVPSILVQASRTATINATLEVGAVT